MNKNLSPSMDNAIGEIKSTQNYPFYKKSYSKIDGLFAFVYILLGWLFIRFFFIYDWWTNFDFRLKLYTVAYITTVYGYAKSKSKDIPKESYFWAVLMVVIAFGFKLENFFILLTRIVTAAYFTSVTGGLYQKGSSSYILGDLINTFITKPFSNFFSIFPALFSVFKTKGNKENTKIHPAAPGVLLGVLALWMIIPLLTRADSNFLNGTTDFISHLLAGFDNIDLTTFIVTSVLALPVACYLFGLGYGSMTNCGIMDKDNIDCAREKMQISPAVSLKVFLYMVCAVYVLFIILQANYLLYAFGGKLYGGMTYAEYAKSGFFELCKVSVINLSIMALCNLLIIPREKDKIRLPMTVLSVLSLMLLSTAMAKMIMYISAYGLTFKRVVSTVFLIWLVIVFLLCIVRLNKNFNLAQVCLLTGAVMMCVMFCFDIELWRYKFNHKYGFMPEVPSIEYADNYNSLYLPEKETVTVIEISDSEGNFYKEISAKGEIMDLLKSSLDTERASVQDYPYADFYYIVNIHSMQKNNSDSDITTLFVYKDGNYFYIEQPYYLICRSDFNWDSILMPYRSE